MKKRLVESFEVSIVATQMNLEIVFRNMVAGWRGLAYSELYALLGYLTYLDKLHHNHHFITIGDPQYGDHQLFQRLYELTNSEFDSLGEKAVGLGGVSNVDLYTILQQANKWCSLSGPSEIVTVPGSSSLARKSLDAELAFIKCIDLASTMLDENGLLTYGLDNMLAGMSDSHESSIYILKQRVSQ